MHAENGDTAGPGAPVVLEVTLGTWRLEHEAEIAVGRWERQRVACCGMAQAPGKQAGVVRLRRGRESAINCNWRFEV